MPTLKTGLTLASALLAATLLTGCATVSVENDSDSVPAIVKMKMPDSTGYEVIKLAPRQSIGRTSLVGGAYSLIVLPDQAYLQLAEQAKDKLETTAILKATQTDPDDMFVVLDILKSVSKSIENMKAGSAACAAHVGDYEDAYATVLWEQSKKIWTATCSNGISGGSGQAGVLGF